MKNRVVLSALFLTISLGFSELVIERMAIRGASFYLSLRTFPSSDFNPFLFLQGGNSLRVGYDIRVFKKAVFPESDLFLTNIKIRYDIKKDYLNDGYVASVWYGCEFAYRRWIDTDEKLLRFLYRLENFRAFSFTEASEEDAFYLEVSQFFDTETNPDQENEIVGRFFRSLLGMRYELSPIRSRVFNKNGILK
ncbi:MAG: hypothetical protein N2314_04245 [Brevinematales bacterium]|nr:hypothetical protein [Brevinematales bacterium]